MANFESSDKNPASAETITHLDLSPSERTTWNEEFSHFRANKQTAVERKPDPKLEQVRLELKKDRTENVPLSGGSSNAVVFSPSENERIHNLRNQILEQEKKPESLTARLRKFFKF